MTSTGSTRRADPRAAGVVKQARVAGGLFILLGALALGEARRLVALREEMIAGATVGDDTFPMIVGVSLLLAGAYAAVAARWPWAPVSFPKGIERRRLLSSVGLLAAYAALTPHLGYTASTFIAATLLFRAMGGYRWVVCLFLGAGVAGALYLMFRVWLLEPLPTGWLGF